MAAAVHEANSSEYADCTVADHSSSIKNESKLNELSRAMTVGTDEDFERSSDFSADGSSAPAPGGATMRLTATLLRGRKVTNYDNEDHGIIEDFMLDMTTGRLGYAVLSFAGTGNGTRLIPVPLRALTVDTDGRRFMLNADREMLGFAPSLDCQACPDTTDPHWRSGIESYYRF